VPLTVASRFHATLARSRDLALADVSAEYEAAMCSVPVRNLLASDRSESFPTLDKHVMFQSEALVDKLRPWRLTPARRRSTCVAVEG
jgi:hypothetical protein